MNKPKKIWICNACDSRQIMAHGMMSWDVDAQEWIAYDQESYSCGECFSDDVKQIEFDSKNAD
jgi:hypothetical protein